MHPIIESILERPASHKIGIWAVTLGLVGFLLYGNVLEETFTELQEMDEKIEKLENQIIANKKVVAQLPKFQREVDVLDKKLNVLLLELPDKKEIPRFLESISFLAVETGLDVKVFAPRGESRRQFFVSVPVELQLEGTFHNLATFFDEVAHLSRIVNITNIDLAIVKETDKGVQIRAKCLATTFRYDEAAVAKWKKGGRKKRRRK